MTIYNKVSITDFKFSWHITFVGLAKKGLLKKTLILSGHDFLAT